ncbi:MAG: hypothetical protein ACLFV7_12060, partial [Phycisphaerae bacterium]
ELALIALVVDRLPLGTVEAGELPEPQVETPELEDGGGALSATEDVENEDDDGGDALGDPLAWRGHR